MEKKLVAIRKRINGVDSGWLCGNIVHLPDRRRITGKQSNEPKRNSSASSKKGTSVDEVGEASIGTALILAGGASLVCWLAGFAVLRCFM